MAPLKGRLRSTMKLSHLRVASYLIALGAVAFQTGIDAQGPVFDVVSIRRNLTPDVNTATQQVHTQKNRVVAPSATLRDLVRAAYRQQTSALRQQLGLRLQRARLPVQMIVIDHVERPSDN